MRRHGTYLGAVTGTSEACARLGASPPSPAGDRSSRRWWETPATPALYSTALLLVLPCGRPLSPLALGEECGTDRILSPLLSQRRRSRAGRRSALGSPFPFALWLAGFVPLCSLGSDGVVGVGRSTGRETLLLVAVAVLSMGNGRGGRSMQQLRLPSFSFLARFDCPAAAIVFVIMQNVSVQLVQL